MLELYIKAINSGGSILTLPHQIAEVPLDCFLNLWIVLGGLEPAGLESKVVKIILNYFVFLGLFFVRLREKILFLSLTCKYIAYRTVSFDSNNTRNSILRSTGSNNSNLHVAVYQSITSRKVRLSSHFLLVLPSSSCII